MANRNSDERFRHREGDGRLVTALQWLLSQAKVRLALTLSAVFTVFGATLALFFMRMIVLDRVLAQDVEMARIDRRVDSIRTRMGLNIQSIDALGTLAGTLIRAECLRTSKADQELLQMQCPPNLYKGVTR